MESSKGKYIVFEGIDGSGKGTQMKLVLEKLDAQQIPYHETQEPSPSPIGKLLRSTFLSGEYDTEEIVRQMLFTADRFDHYHNKEHGIKYKLEQGINVISDRSYLSGIAYAWKAGWDIYKGLEEYHLKPDLVIFLDIESTLAMERISKDREKLEIYENATKLCRTRSRYLNVVGHMEDSHLIKIHDASGSIESVHEGIMRDINKIL